MLPQELLSELGKDASVPVRLRAIKEVQGLVREKRLQEHGVDLLWYKVRDMIDPREQEEEATRKQVGEG